MHGLAMQLIKKEIKERTLQKQKSIRTQKMKHTSTLALSMNTERETESPHHALVLDILMN